MLSVPSVCLGILSLLISLSGILLLGLAICLYMHDTVLQVLTYLYPFQWSGPLIFIGGCFGIVVALRPARPLVMAYGVTSLVLLLPLLGMSLWAGYEGLADGLYSVKSRAVGDSREDASATNQCLFKARDKTDPWQPTWDKLRVHAWWVENKDRSDIPDKDRLEVCTNETAVLCQWIFLGISMFALFLVIISMVFSACLAVLGKPESSSPSPFPSYSRRNARSHYATSQRLSESPAKPVEIATTGQHSSV